MPFKPRSGKTGIGTYAIFGCPHCDAEVEVLKQALSTLRARACKAHLAVCPEYTPPAAPKETDLAAELRKAREAHEAEREEAQRRHEELMSQLRDANGQLSSVKGQLSDVEGQLRDKRQCLTDVREWGQLREPDNTLVPQLTCREEAMAATYQTEVSRLKAELEVLRAAAKEKAPATLVARAAEAETKMAKADAKVARAEEEAEAKVAKMQHDWDAFRAAKYLEVGNANANASRAMDKADNLKRKIQLLVHPDKVPEEARTWATHMFQTLFPPRR
jgi:chromosome segregation ATPase